MKVDDLVPTFKTCADIPQGCFEDSAFVWAAVGSDRQVLIREGLWHEAVLCPAPTLEEILKGSQTLRLMPYHGGKAGDFDTASTGLAVMLGERTEPDGRRSRLLEVCEYADLKEPDFKTSARNASEAALRAWLRVMRSVKIVLPATVSTEDGGRKTEGGPSAGSGQAGPSTSSGQAGSGPLGKLGAGRALRQAQGGKEKE